MSSIVAAVAGAGDLFDMNELVAALSTLIVDNLSATRWLLKVRTPPLFAWRFTYCVYP
jgi:hypothetical protein